MLLPPLSLAYHSRVESLWKIAPMYLWATASAERFFFSCSAPISIFVVSGYPTTPTVKQKNLPQYL